MSDGHEPDRARWSYVLDGVALLGAMALGFGGTVLTLYTQNALWAVAGVIPAFALIGLAAFLRIIAKPRPWRGMRLQLLV